VGRVVLQCGAQVLWGGGVEIQLKGIGDFSRFVRYEVGDGLKIHYGYDIWCGDQTLMEAFLVLYGIAYFKEASM
jgi:hypothetical protein